MTKRKRRIKHGTLAAIEYHGGAGITRDCMDAVMRLIQYNDQITKARILTSGNVHCVLLTVNVGDLIAVKSGFRSGYGGEGPSGFSYILRLLKAHGAEIEEYKVRKDLINRLDNSCLTQLDLDRLDIARPVRPSNLSDYIRDRDWDIEKNGRLWREFPPVIPLAIIDPRLVDLAKNFWDDPDRNLHRAYRRLEDIVRDRTGLDEYGSKLFSKAFRGAEAKLVWAGIDTGEQEGRAGLFISTYQAFRNPRSHVEMTGDMSEFINLNSLYQLEEGATEKK